MNAHENATSPFAKEFQCKCMPVRMLRAPVQVNECQCKLMSPSRIASKADPTRAFLRELEKASGTRGCLRLEGAKARDGDEGHDETDIDDGDDDDETD